MRSSYGLSFPDSFQEKVQAFKPYRKQFLKSFCLLFVFVYGLLVSILYVIYSIQKSNEVAIVKQAEFYRLHKMQSAFVQSLSIVTFDLQMLSEIPSLYTYLKMEPPHNLVGLNSDLLVFSQARPDYDRIQYINEKGMEVTRIVANNGNPYVANAYELQNYSDWPFFQKTVQLPARTINISSMELALTLDGGLPNPEAPVIRYSIPVYTKEGINRGIIILTYRMYPVFCRLENCEHEIAYPLLIDERGFYLYNLQDPNSTWGFQLQERQDRRFDLEFADEWEMIRSKLKGQVETSNGLFTFMQVIPADSFNLTQQGAKELLIADQPVWNLVLYYPRLQLTHYIGKRTDFWKFYALYFLVFAAVFSSILTLRSIEKIREDNRLRHNALHDQLTGLPNRGLFLDRLEQEIQRLIRYKIPFTVIAMDLDGFKDINDNYGHAAGDKVLKTIATRLICSMRKTDTVARMGGDEINLIVQGSASQQWMSNLANQLLKEISRPIEYNHETLKVTGSLGISMHDSAGDDCDQVLKKADAALYAAKRAGKNQAVFYSENMQTEQV